MKKRIITWTLTFSVCCFAFLGLGGTDFAAAKAKIFSAGKLSALVSNGVDRGLSDNGYTKDNVKISASAVNKIRPVTKTIFKDGLPIKWSNEITDEGEYKVEIIDKNITVFSWEFVIDRKDPTIVVREGKDPISMGDTVSGPVSIRIYDKSPVNKVVRVNGKRVQIPSNGVFSEKGNYIVTATDFADNSKTFKFKIK